VSVLYLFFQDKRY